MESEFWLSPFGKLLRWVLFLPISIISAFIVALFAFAINYVQSIFTGDDIMWAYFAGALFSQLALLYVAWYILPSQKEIILFVLFGLRLLFSFLWFVEPSASPLSIGGLIFQEILVLGSSFVLIRSLLEKDKNNIID